MSEDFDIGFGHCDKDEYVLEVDNGALFFSTSDLVDLCDLIVTGNCKNLADDLNPPRAYLFFKKLYECATEALESRGIDLHTAVEDAEADLAAFNELTGKHSGADTPKPLKLSGKMTVIPINREKEN